MHGEQWATFGGDLPPSWHGLRRRHKSQNCLRVCIVHKQEAYAVEAHHSFPVTRVIVVNQLKLDGRGINERNTACGVLELYQSLDGGEPGVSGALAIFGRQCVGCRFEFGLVSRPEIVQRPEATAAVQGCGIGDAVFDSRKGDEMASYPSNPAICWAKPGATKAML